jgi:hypothetical protein
MNMLSLSLSCYSSLIIAVLRPLYLYCAYSFLRIVLSFGCA